MNKSRALCEAARKAFGDRAMAEVCASGLMVRLEIRSGESAQALQKRAQEAGIAVRAERESADGESPRLLLASAGVPLDDFEIALGELRDVLCRKNKRMANELQAGCV